MKHAVAIGIVATALAGAGLAIEHWRGPRSDANERSAVKEEGLREGDIVFQVSLSKQCEAVRAATGSPYAHCGMVHFEGDVPFVLEAVQPVRSISLAEWTTHGRNGHYVVKRLADADMRLTPDVLKAMRSTGASWIGRNYDAAFNWSDAEIYCSELVWKIYERAAAVELCVPRKLREFDLSSPVVKEVMQARYGNDVPLDEPMVSPGDLFASERLVEVLRVGKP